MTIVKLFVCSAPLSIAAEVGLDEYKAHFGLLTTPRSGHTPRTAVNLGVPWAMDNDAFSGFNAEAFLKMMRRYQGIQGCKWVAVPDVVGDAKSTLKRFYQWQPAVTYFGFSSALVAQDGLEDLPIPWDKFTCLFIGGSTEWKLGAVAAGIIREAKRREKWIHMGRVNSAIRVRYTQLLDCDSSDGSGYARFKSRTRDILPVLQTRQLSLGMAA